MLGPLPEIVWTRHSRAKMRQYNLSESRIKRVLRYPKRKEIGVAPQTIALMQPAGSKKHPFEIWVMYQVSSAKTKSQKPKRRVKIISVWRYPGISPIHEPPPIPDDIRDFLSII